jgi:hypothetical protein
LRVSNKILLRPDITQADSVSLEPMPTLTREQALLWALKTSSIIIAFVKLQQRVSKFLPSALAKVM